MASGHRGAVSREGGRPRLVRTCPPHRRYAAAAAGLTAALALFAAPAQAACTIQRIVELPVFMSGDRPLVAAKINGQDVRFIADSGAFFSLISPDMAAALKLPVQATSLRIRGIGGSAEVGVATVRKLTLAGVDIPNVQFTVGGSTTGLAGLLGQNILGFADVEYDLAGGAIRLFKPQDCGKLGFAYWAGDKPFSVLPIDSPDALNRHTRGTVTLNGVKLRAIFDTGASHSVIDLAAAARAGIRPGDPGVEPVGVEHGLGSGLNQAWRARFASFKIGDNEEIRNGRVQVSKLDLDDTDMLIGADFFLSHRVYVSNRQHRLYFTYNGGPAFAVSTSLAGAAVAVGSSAGVDNRDAPTDADGFARRGDARAARGDSVGALADLDEAVRRAPDRADILLDRAEARLAARQREAARSDLDHVVTLDPANARARVIRARVALAGRDTGAALLDLDAAAAGIARQDAMRREIGALYTDAGAPDRAIAQYTLWIAAHPEDSGLADAYNGRCWARGLAGIDLDKALGDCDSALRRRPGAASFLDSRGLVHLRRNELDRARVDYDAAIAAAPRVAWSLYGRSIVERRSGQSAQADADRAAAIAINPALPERAHRYGIGD